MARNRLIKRVFMIGGILVTSLAVIFYRPFLADWLRLGKKIPEEPSIVIGERTLIIAPHPDDETLGGAGLIQKALAAGKKVKVAIMTTGDGFTRAVEENLEIERPSPSDYQKLGELRHLESLNAMKHFGVPKENVIFLGYPDAGVEKLWQSHWDYDNLFKGLTGISSSPYDFGFEKHAPYCGANVVKNLSEILRDFRPTDVVYPDPNDHHPDHWATGAFVKYTLTAENYRSKEWTYLVHRGDFPAPWKYMPKLPLHPPYVLSGLDTHWVYLPLTQQEKQKKRAAIQKYVTQTKVMDAFLKAFVRTNELLGYYVDPVLPITSEEPDFNNPNKLPYALFFDAHADNFRREIEKDADIMTIGAVYAKEKLFIGLETGKPISDRVMYNLRIRLFHPEGVRRLDLTVYKSQVTARKYAHNSLDLPPATTVDVKGNRLWISLPANILNRTRAILLSADTFIDQKQIDKTSWRLIKVTMP